MTPPLPLLPSYPNQGDDNYDSSFQQNSEFFDNRIPSFPQERTSHVYSVPPQDLSSSYQHNMHFSSLPSFSIPFSHPATPLPPPYVAGPNDQTTLLQSTCTANSVCSFPPTYKRKAVVIGINYFNDSRYRLSGCTTDANCIEYMLLSKLNFQPPNILKLTDASDDYPKMPTKKNILQALKWLVRDAVHGDTFFFHFSGHGSQVLDRSGDESDGWDETICPVDFKSAGMIIDDELFNILVRPLPFGARLFSIMDCCHSGTGLDLPICYTYKDGHIRRKAEGPSIFSTGLANLFFNSKRKKFKNASHVKGLAVLFSSCADSETCMDTNKLSGGVFNGVMTFAFIQCIENYYPDLTFGSLLMHLNTFIKSKSFKQEPNLSSTQELNFNEKFYI
ncbi:uncharacterized protein LOC135121190 [Zophobas morio]|uniref:uncharacterized protein LOC135121190 n=1 Tax=Zophobas morio TaxID=2755281 RepID=UPI0030834EA5